MATLLDLLLPRTCPGCRLEGVLLCATCARPLRRRLDEPPGAPIGLATWMPAGLVQLEWLAVFTGTTRATLHALKYGGGRDLAQPLGTLMATRWAHAGRGGDLLVPVPVHRARLHERGYDQAVLLAAVAARQLGLPLVAALRRENATVAQHGLGHGARAGNLRHAFAVTSPGAHAIRGRWVVLVDDILTTGATLSAGATALRAAGARAVSALVVARER